MAIRKRIERLEAKQGEGTASGPSLIFLCDGETGEPQSAIRIGGGSITRKRGETRKAFQTRAKNPSCYVAG